MDFLRGFLLRVLKVTPRAEEEAGRMRIIVKRPYAYLEEELRNEFAGQENVEIIVERRYGERRTTQQHAALERRRGERRRTKEELIESVISL